MTADMTAEVTLDRYVQATLGRKSFGVVVLDVGKLTSIADTFILCSGRSNRQVSAIAEHIETDLKTAGKRPLSVDGLKEGHWVVLDYGHVIIHVFYDSVRRFYDLESLWADAERLKPPSLVAHEQALEMASALADAEEWEEDEDE
jgi:ribosome-associated protein